MVTDPVAKGSNRQRADLSPAEPFMRFVEPEEFRSLLISNRKLERFDDATADLRGLLDASTGECFVIEEAKLFVAASSP